jgi:hypothetical protein
MNGQNQVRNELVELLHEIVDGLVSRKPLQLTDEDVRRYEARAAHIRELSKEIRNPE